MLMMSWRGTFPGCSVGCVGWVVSLQADLTALVANTHRFRDRATVGNSGQDQQACRDQLVTDPRVRLGEPCSGKLAGDLGAEIVTTLSSHGEPLQKRLPPLVLGGEQRFTVKPGGVCLVGRRHVIQCHTSRAQYKCSSGVAWLAYHRIHVQT